MSKTWFVGDLHLGHRNIITFKSNEGANIRPFKSIEEHDETLIQNHNKLVKPEDRVYFFGDLAIGRKHISTIGKFNGRKKLIKGNHDIFKLKDYLPFFDDIVSYRIYPEHGIICSHIPVHTCQLERRFKFNVHGHLHSNRVLKPVLFGLFKKPDERYINVCPEHTDFKPVDFEDILERIKNQ